MDEVNNVDRFGDGRQAKTDSRNRDAITRSKPNPETMSKEIENSRQSKTIEEDKY